VSFSSMVWLHQALLSRLLRSGSPVGVDAALVSLNFLSTNDVDVVWEALAMREPFMASLRVMVQVLRQPQPRSVRCVIATLCGLVGPTPAALLSTYNAVSAGTRRRWRRCNNPLWLQPSTA
jgi:hypothetical protein